MNGWPFVSYLLENVEASLLMADPEIMKLCASLVEDPAIRDVMLERILNEFQLARDGISARLGSSPADRRPRLLRTLERRAQGLAWLHREQVRLLRAWRAKPEEGALRPSSSR